MEDNNKKTKELIQIQEIRTKKEENLVYLSDSPELQSKNIYYNCSECSSAIQILFVDEKEIEFRCSNNDHHIKMKINEYLEKMKSYKTSKINDEICHLHNKEYYCYCFDCNKHLCKECINLRKHNFHYKIFFFEIIPDTKILNEIEKIINNIEIKKRANVYELIEIVYNTYTTYHNNYYNIININIIYNNYFNIDNNEFVTSNRAEEKDIIIKEQSNLLKEKEELIKEKNDKYEELNRELYNKDKIIKENENNLNIKNDIIKEMENKLKEKDTIIKDKEIKIKEKDDMIKTYEDKLKQNINMIKNDKNEIKIIYKNKENKDKKIYLENNLYLIIKINAKYYIIIKNMIYKVNLILNILIN